MEKDLNLLPDEACPPAGDEEAARFRENSESSASRIRRVCHVPVDSMRAWLHTIFYPWSLLSKKVKMARMLLLL